MMEDEVAKERADSEFEQRREQMRKKDEEKTGKNRKRREKKRKGKDEKEAMKENGQSEAMQSQHHYQASLPTFQPDSKVRSESSATAVEQVGVIIHDDDD